MIDYVGATGNAGLAFGRLETASQSLKFKAYLFFIATFLFIYALVDLFSLATPCFFWLLFIFCSNRLDKYTNSPRCMEDMSMNWSGLILSIASLVSSKSLEASFTFVQSFFWNASQTFFKYDPNSSTSWGCILPLSTVLLKQALSNASNPILERSALERQSMRSPNVYRITTWFSFNLRLWPQVDLTRFAFFDLGEGVKKSKRWSISFFSFAVSLLWI